MAANKIWSYFLQLSVHMWDDENSPPRGWDIETRYNENNNCDPVMWDEIVDFIAERKFNMCVIDVGDGIHYESHPEISAPDAWDKDYMRQKLDAMRAKGIEPVPKLNFSACHHTWLKEYRHKVSTPEYYRACADVIGEVCEVFGNPRLFHLGMDEENYGNQRYREMVTIRGDRLWWHDMYFFFAECEKHGARPWIWSDYYWDHPDLFEKNMPKSVLQSNWYYYHFNGDTENKSISAYRRLDELGFDQVPGSSTWSVDVNERETLLYCKKRLDDSRLLGYLTIPWTGNTRDDEFRLKNDAHRFYLARREVYPESL